MDLPISDGTWSSLVAKNSVVSSIWAQTGVFGTGVGPDYSVGSSLLYVGKSAGPLGGLVGSGVDQEASCRASLQWMISKRNKSAFWQFVDNIDFSRRTIAWTNICKMDVRGGQRPPGLREWSHVSDISMRALREEMEFLKPKVTVFATSGLYGGCVSELLADLGFKSGRLNFEDGWSSLFENASGQSVFLTKHPQGWPNTERDRVLMAVKERLR